MTLTFKTLNYRSQVLSDHKNLDYIMFVETLTVFNITTYSVCLSVTVGFGSFDTVHYRPALIAHELPLTGSRVESRFSSACTRSRKTSNGRSAPPARGIIDQYHYE